MKEDQKNRDHWLHVRLTEAEKLKLIKAFEQTTHTKLSDYARAILLRKPMIAAVRNQSLQDILSVLVKLRNDFHGIANNYNQAVHKLHTIDHIPEYKSWLNHYEKDRVKMLNDLEEIKQFINQTSEKWLQS